MLHSFGAVDTEGDNTHGAYPAFGVLLGRYDDHDGDRDVALYGAAAGGGMTGNGTLYRLQMEK